MECAPLHPPAVSIVLPTLGTRGSLAAALRSALAQEGIAFELVVVDDAPAGSPWRRGAEIAALLADARMRVVPSHVARGCAAAKNLGLAAARGEWVCYLDDDNEYRPQKIAKQHALALATGSPVVLCGLEYRMGARRRVRQTGKAAYAGDGLLLEALPDTNVLFHRRDIGVRWDEALGTVDDACFFQAALVRHGLASVPNVAEPLAIYHAHAGERANRGYARFYAGQRRLVVRWSRSYSRAARRILLLRSLVAFAKFQPGKWGQLARCGGTLVRLGGWREWRGVVNAAGVKLPLVRSWMVT